MSLKYDGANIVLAKNLRRDATPQEKRLWYGFLAKYPVRFQRQKAIGRFIADFYCYKAKLVIEIDGSQHATADGVRRDEFRTKILQESDLKVIRFSNEQIDRDFRRVCEYIDEAVKAALAPPNAS